MQEKSNEIDLIQIFRTIWHRRKQLLRLGVVGLVVGIVIAFSIPAQYMSKVLVAPEARSASSSMNSMGGLASMMGVNIPGASDDGIDTKVYPEVVKSTPFLAEFQNITVSHKGQSITLQKYLNKEQKKAWWSHIFALPSTIVGWFSSDDSLAENDKNTDMKNPKAAQRQFEEILSARINVAIDKKTGLLVLSSVMQDPYIAMVVADSLVVKLERYMADYYTSKARADLESSLSMFDNARTVYYKADSAYAAGWDKNQNLVSKSAQVQIERLKNERDLAFGVYQQLASQVELNRISLQKATPIVTVIEPARVPDRAISPNKLLIILSAAFGTCAIMVLLILKDSIFENNV